MSYTFELLETKRSHVKTYSTKVPPKEEIYDAVWKAWKTSPSKNNAMAYEVLIWGPDKKAEDRAVEKDLATKTQQGKPNPYYEHIRYNPYLLTIHSRLATPNRFYKRQIEKGHFYDQAFQSYVDRIVDSVAVEVGLFA